MSATTGTPMQLQSHGGGVQNDAGYFSRLRTDVLEQVPRDCRHVLSVGCGQGATEAELIKLGMKVTGIEINPEAATVARSRGLEILEADAQSTALQGRQFDCLIYADVLEHLPDPSAVLREHVQLLRKGGRVIVSVPNFRNYRVFGQLFLQGHIRYTDEGIFDRTHLRLTTRRMVQQWFDESGLAVRQTRYLIYRRRDKLISAALLGLAREFIALQVLLVGEKQ